MTILWTNPLEPGIYSTIPTDNTTTLRDRLELQHDKVWIIYENTGNIYEALKNQSIDTAEHKYLKELQNKYSGFLRVMFHDLIKNLLNQYMNTMSAGLENNNHQMNYPIDS